MNKIRFTQVTLAGLIIVITLSFIARITFLNGSLFDPSVAPGFGPFALGDILFIACFAVGYLFSMKKVK
jgi:hypothetical protein